MAQDERGPALGRVSSLDLRTVWPTEDDCFTPWLAKPENLALLAQELGLELRSAETQVRIGSFKADIVARTSDASAAVIENQLDDSNHKHLGQLLTYCAGLDDAAVAIWIARAFRSEHRRALDRLNDWSPTGMEFYGVELAAIKIGDSEVAPDFRPIAFPSEWEPHREEGSIARSLAARYRAFFEGFLSEISRSGAVQVVRRSHDLRRLRWAEDPTCVTCQVQFLRRNRVSVALIIEDENVDETKLMFDRLYEQHEQIEAEIGTELQWSKQPGRRTSIVRWHGTGDILGSDTELAQISGWMLDSLARLRAAYGPHVDSILAKLDLEVE